MCSQTRHSFADDILAGDIAQQPFSKRLFDVCFVAAALTFLMPLFAALALTVLLTQGSPILYRQNRLSLNGRLFPCLKFRSMVRNSEAVLAKHLAENPQAAREWAERVKLARDPRITRFGCFLRRSSFDELPQLFNILAGDMSLVGPRPILPEELATYGNQAGQLLSVRPGLTGLWQVSGRNTLSLETQVRLDIEYIRNWSFLGDLKIILKTIPAVLLQRGAM